MMNMNPSCCFSSTRFYHSYKSAIHQLYLSIKIRNPWWRLCIYFQETLYEPKTKDNWALLFELTYLNSSNLSQWKLFGPKVENGINLFAFFPLLNKLKHYFDKESHELADYGGSLLLLWVYKNIFPWLLESPGESI